jgi:hypothetical protein
MCRDTTRDPHSTHVTRGEKTDEKRKPKIEYKTAGALTVVNEKSMLKVAENKVSGFRGASALSPERNGRAP